MFKSIRGRIAAGASLLAVAIVAAGISVAHAQDDEVDNGQATAQAEHMIVGTFEYERALDEFRETVKFMERLQEMEQEAMAARQAGNMQREMELGMEYQMRQHELIQSFESKMVAAMPQIAQEQNLQVIAINVLYTEPDIERVDITDEVIEKVNALSEAEEAQADDEQAAEDE